MVRRQRVTIFLAVALCISCNPAPAPKKAAAAARSMRATVVTIRTVIQPGNKTLDHTIVIANGRARSGDELDRWRLFDVANDRVTFVDDINKTFRTLPMDTLVHDRLGALDDPLPDSIPRAQIVAARAAKSMQGVIARQWIVKLGGYSRELWIAEHPSIPPKLFAMMLASRPPSSDFEPMMKSVDSVLLKTSGFPLAEHSELPYGNKKMTVDKSVVSIEQRDVPQWWLSVNPAYKDVTPTAPAANPRSAS